MNASDLPDPKPQPRRPVKVCIVEAEPGDQEYFASALPDYELEFASALSEVSEDQDVISVFIYSKVDESFLVAHPRLRLVFTRSTTTDHIDLDACARRGVAVVSVQSYGDHTVAEHTFALLLAVARRLREVMGAKRRPGFSFEELRSFELRDKTIGLLGAGRVGQQVIPIARAFGMHVLVEDPLWNRALAQAVGVELVSLDEALTRSDILSLHAPLTRETYHLLNRDTLARCRRGVIIINTARGGLIDTLALSEALDSGQVAGAGLDVLEEERVLRNDAARIVSEQIVERLHASSRFAPQESRDPKRVRQLMEVMRSEALLERPNVVFTPHIAFNSVEAVERINRETVSVIRAFIRNGGLQR